MRGTVSIHSAFPIGIYCFCLTRQRYYCSVKILSDMDVLLLLSNAKFFKESEIFLRSFPICDYCTVFNFPQCDLTKI